MWKSENHFSLLFSALGCACGWSGIFSENRRSLIICTIICAFRTTLDVAESSSVRKGGELIYRLVSRQLRPVTVVVFVFSGKTQTNYGDFPIYWNHFDVALCRRVSSPLTLPQRETWQDKNLFFTLQPPDFQVGCAIVLLWLGINIVLTFCTRKGAH